MTDLSSLKLTSSSFHSLGLPKKQLFLDRPRRHVPTEAIRNYNLGDLVTSCRPFAKVVNENLKRELCDYCLEKRSDLKRCKACESFYYCSKECQIADWNEAHKFKECNLYRMDKGHVLEKQIASCRLIARIYLILRNSNIGEIKSQKYSSILYKDFNCFNGHKRNFIELMSHFNNFKSNPLMDTFWKFKKVYKHVLRTKYDWNSDDLLVIMGILNSNAFEIARNPDEPLASGLFIETAIFDHSCVANARFSFDKDQMNVIASRPIKSGEKICIHYVDPEPRDEFYTTMKANHYFACNCAMCQKLSQLDRDKFEFNVLRRAYHGHSYRGSILMGMLTLKKMIALSKKWPQEKHMNTDVQNLLALETLAQLGDSVDKLSFGLPPFDEIYAKRNSSVVLESLSGGITQLKDYLDSRKCHKIAEKEYMTGDYIRDSIPCVYVVLPQFKKQYCNLCLVSLTSNDSTIYSCEKCQKFTYCSIKCRASDKTLHNDFECPLNIKDTSEVLQMPESAEKLLHIRMYMSPATQALHFKYLDERVYVDGGKDNGVQGMTTNKQTNGNNKGSTYKVFCKNTNVLPSNFGSPLYDLLDFIEETWTQYAVNYHKLVDIFTFCLPNMFYICDNRTNEKIAIGSFTTFRLTEHSLNPNSEYLLQDGKLSLRATTTIGRGSSINIGYN